MDFYSLPDNKTFLVTLKAAIVKNGKVLLLHSTEVHKNWEFPGGIVNLDETLENGLAREVLEETTLKIKIGEAIGASDEWRNNFRFDDNKVRDARVVEIVFRCELLSGIIQLSEEHSESKWVTLKDIETLTMFPGHRRAVIDALGERKNETL